MFLFTYTAAFLSIFLVGFAVFLFTKKKHDPLVMFLGLSTIATIVWVGSNAAADISTADPILIFFSGTAFIGATFLVSFYLTFADRFLTKKPLSKTKLFLYYAPSVYFSLTAFSKLSVLETLYPEGVPAQIIPGINYNLLLLFIPLTIIYVGIRLTIAYFVERKSKQEQKMNQILYIGMSFLWMFSGMMVFSIFLPLLGELRFFTVGPQFTILFLIFASYAIFKYKLLDIKAVATEVLTFTLWVTILIRTFFTTSIQERIINVIVLIVLVFLGVLLIRSVLQEVNAREKVEHLAERLKNFISFATHELRRPIANIKGGLSNILEGDYEPVPNDVVTLSRGLYMQAYDMGQTVEQFLNINKAQDDKLKPLLQPNNIVKTIKAVVAEARYYATMEKIRIAFDAPDTVPAFAFDLFQIKHVLKNIIDNAIKYNNPGGSVQVRVVRKGNEVVVSVADTGVGIDPKDQETVFTRYNPHIHTSIEKAIESNGIGMWLSKKIITAHGGKIRVESKGHGKGSTFFFSLPTTQPVP